MSKGQHTRVRNILLTNAHYCREHLGVLPRTIHIVMPGQRYCRGSHGDAKREKHGDFHVVGDQGILVWEEYRQPLTFDMLDKCWDHYHRGRGSQVVVHCAAGLHRSPTITLALLSRASLTDPLYILPELLDGMREYPIPASPHFDVDDLRTVNEWLHT